MLKKAPIVIRLYPEKIQEMDLMREIRIDKQRLSKELLRQPARYLWWAALYAEVTTKCEFLRERLAHLEARLAIRYTKRLREEDSRVRVTDVRYFVSCDSAYRSLRKKLRRWERAERLLKFAERAFSQRKDVLQSYSANTRREQDSEPKVRKHREEEED